MLDALMNYLNAFTDIPFVELAWSHSPDDKYGVVTLDNQIALDADADPVSEKMLTGFVDVFVKKPKDLSTVSDVESALKRLGIWFAMNSVQFEDDTGYVHYEWIWRDAIGKATEKIALIRFDLLGQITESWMQYGATPTPPSFTPVYMNPSGVDNGGIWLVMAGWNPPIVPVSGNADYKADVSVAVRVSTNHELVNAKENSPISASGFPSDFIQFTQESYDLMKLAFENGYSVTDHYADGIFRYRVKKIDGYTAIVEDANGDEHDVNIEVI